MRSSIRIVGTETGRTSTSSYGFGKGAKKSPERPDRRGIAFQTITKHGDVGNDIRSMYIPDDGKILLEVDLSQAEARVSALLSEDWHWLESFDKYDTHKETASWFYNCIMKDVDYLQRFVGKIGTHMTDYDAGAKRLCQEIITQSKRFGI